MNLQKITRNKKAVSDMVSYVLLIVIALAIAGGVYSWLRFYVPSQVDSQKCSEDVALAITDYNCSNRIIELTVENKGYFSSDGFFIRASNDSTKLPVIGLNTTKSSGGLTNLPGRYDIANRFKPGAIEIAPFDYAPMEKIQRIQIQPFVVGKKGELLTCTNIVDINLENCN